MAGLIEIVVEMIQSIKIELTQSADLDMPQSICIAMPELEDSIVASISQDPFVTSFLHSGSVLGLLKVGTKDLYLFDEHGETRKMEQSPSILDFYVHESRQRAGLGKHLFETMLKEEQWTPLKCSVDRPSDKLLGFLGKHYGLLRTIPQANNFVLYEGFFNDVNSTPNGSRNGHAESPQRNNGMHITNR